MEDKVERAVVHDIYSDWEAHAKSCGRCILALQGGVGIGFGMRTIAEPCDEGREKLGAARFQILDFVDRGSLSKRWAKGLPLVSQEELEQWREATALRNAQLVAAGDLVLARYRAFTRRRELLGGGPAAAEALWLELGSRAVVNCDDEQAPSVLLARVGELTDTTWRETAIRLAMLTEGLIDSRRPAEVRSVGVRIWVGYQSDAIRYTRKING